MNGKILLATVEYLAKKLNPNEEDLRNEKRAWKQLVEIGIKEETEIPARLAEVEILSAEEVEQAESEKLEKERLEREAAEQAEKDLLAKEETERRDKESKERNADQGGEKGNGEAEQKQGDPNPETASQPKKTETKKAASPK